MGTPQARDVVHLGREGKNCTALSKKSEPIAEVPRSVRSEIQWISDGLRLGVGVAAHREPVVVVVGDTTSADQVNGLVPILRIHLLHDAIDVVLYSEFGEVEVCGDLFVG